jgi:ectoine hydroxylase-related dioxygenase (phytanoyl-CoA dioxygenase family)
MTESIKLPTDAEVVQYAAEGAVVLRGVFAEWIETLRAGVTHVMASPGPYERTYQPKDGTARFFQDLCNWQRIEEFGAFVRHSPAAEIAARLMGSRTARFFHDHILVKEPGSSIVTPWHQDLPYYCVAGEQNVSFWIPLDPIARDVTLECVAGSHLWGRSYRPKRFDGTDLYAGDVSIQMPDIDADRSAYAIRGWEVEPGDAVAFNFATVHGAPANISQSKRRRVFSARWVGEDAIFVDREGKGSPPFAHLTLKTGDPLDGADFPLIFKR